jgi:hypothetical protein
MKLKFLCASYKRTFKATCYDFCACLFVFCLHVDSVFWYILDCGLVQIILRAYLCTSPILCVCVCILRHCDEMCYMLLVCVLSCLRSIDIKSVTIELSHMSFSILCQSFMKLNVQHLHSLFTILHIESIFPKDFIALIYLESFYWSSSCLWHKHYKL